MYYTEHIKTFYSFNLSFKSALSGLSQFLTTEIPLENMKKIKNAFYFV